MYLAVIVDLFSRKVVGWSLSERMTAELVCDALDAAVEQRRPPPGLVFHSDRGAQYASRAFRRRLWRYRMRQSMSRKGDCWDNAVAESFFATPKKELVRDLPFESRAAAHGDVFEYIEVFYNRQRAHSLLGYETPTSFEACEKEASVAYCLSTRPGERINSKPLTCALRRWALMPIHLAAGEARFDSALNRRSIIGDKR